MDHRLQTIIELTLYAGVSVRLVIYRGYFFVPYSLSLSLSFLSLLSRSLYSLVLSLSLSLSFFLGRDCKDTNVGCHFLSFSGAIVKILMFVVCCCGTDGQ